MAKKQQRSYGETITYVIDDGTSFYIKPSDENLEDYEDVYCKCDDIDKAGEIANALNKML